MSIFKKLIFSVCAICLLASCSKEEEEFIAGNVAPPDETIESVTISNYVQKLYISLLGRKPTDAEKANDIEGLTTSSLSIDSREAVVKSISSKSDYIDNEYSILRTDVLNGADSAAFAGAKFVMEFSLTLTVNPLELDFWNDELSRIQPLIDLEANLNNGSKSLIDAHKIVVYNYIYDQINMGAENFVISLFQNFLFRNPTEAELESGKSMYNDVSGTLFTISGKTRVELLDVFFGSLEYYEGQVRANYLRFLYREPTDNEIALLATQYQIDKDYNAIQKYILSSDEYLGIE